MCEYPGDLGKRGTVSRIAREFPNRARNTRVLLSWQEKSAGRWMCQASMTLVIEVCQLPPLVLSSSLLTQRTCVCDLPHVIRRLYSPADINCLNCIAVIFLGVNCKIGTLFCMYQSLLNSQGLIKCRHTDIFHFLYLQMGEEMLEYHDLQRDCDPLGLGLTAAITKKRLLTL